MKTKLHRFIALFLCCMMLMGLSPLTALAEDAGYTKANPIKVTTYEELKSALENPQINYVEVSSGTNITEIRGVSINNSPFITVNGLKVLTVNGSVTLSASADSDYAVRSMLYLFGAGNYLGIGGNGSLTFRANATNAMNAVVELHNKGTLSVDGNVTLNGSYNNAVYGTAIRNCSGTVQIHGGTFIGQLANNSGGGWGGAVMTDAGSQTFIRNATLKSVKLAGTEDEPVFCTTVHVAKGANVQIENSTIEATRNAANGYSIYIDDVGQNIAKCLSNGQKIYRLSDDMQLNTNASYTKDDVFIARGLPNEITALALSANEITSGTRVSDMALTSDSSDVSYENYSVYEGLNQTGSGTALSNSAELKPQNNYSAIYELNASPGKYFVSDLNADDIQFKNGYVTDVKLTAGTKAARVFVNFPKNERVIDELSFETPEIDVGMTVNDMRITKFPRDKVIFSLFLIYSGLKESGPQLAGSTMLDPADPYSAMYQFTADGPYFFADDLAPKDITITNGIVTGVVLSSDNKTVEIHVDFPMSSIISRFDLEINKITKTTKVEDMQITKFPGDKVYWDYYAVFEHLNRTEDDSASMLPNDKVLNPAYDYSAYYQVRTRPGKTFAENFSKDNITFKNGEVWNIKLLSDTIMLVYVNFPGIDPNITSVSFNVKKPVPGEALDETYTPVSEEPDKYVLYDSDWYVSENGVAKYLYKGDRFEVEKKYTMQFRILPTDEDNTHFVYNNTTVKLNGNAATIMYLAPPGEGIVARYTFTTPKNIKMTFDANGGEGTQEPVNIDEYGDIAMPECTFTKEGDEFFAWKVEENLYFPGDTCNITQNSTATAVWKSELTKDIAITMDAISEGKTPAEIVFGCDTEKFSVSAVWYEGDEVYKFKKLEDTAPLSVHQNYTVRLTIHATEFLAGKEDLNITIGGKKMEDILSRKSKQVILDVKILNDISVEFFEPMAGVPLPTSSEMKPNSDRFYAESEGWFPRVDAMPGERYPDGTVAQLGRKYCGALTLRSAVENQIFGGDTITINGKAYPVTYRDIISSEGCIGSTLEFVATNPQVKMSERSNGAIIVNSPIAMDVTFVAVLYDPAGKAIDVVMKPNFALTEGEQDIAPYTILDTKTGKFLVGTKTYKVKFMIWKDGSSISPMCPPLIYKTRIA